MTPEVRQIEQRLSNLEVAVNVLQQKAGLTPPANWVEQIAGSMADIPEEDYQKFRDFCQAVRNGDFRETFT